MKKVTETHVEKAIEEISAAADSNADSIIQPLIDHYRNILQFIMTGDEDDFSENELDMLLFVTASGIKAMELAGLKPRNPSPEHLRETEERYYEQWDSLKGSTEEKLDRWYDDNRQPELMLLAEDILMDEEDGLPQQVQVMLFIKAVAVFDTALS